MYQQADAVRPWLAPDHPQRSADDLVLRPLPDSVPALYPAANVQGLAWTARGNSM